MPRPGPAFAGRCKKTGCPPVPPWMTKPWVLDTGPLGRLAHPNPNEALAGWITTELERGVTIVIPEISDYELRRNLLLEGLHRSVARLDELKSALRYLPISTEVMTRAAGLWATARKQGIATCDRAALDGDVILAAQALSIGGRVATENVGHLARFVEAKDWREFLHG